MAKSKKETKLSEEVIDENGVVDATASINEIDGPDMAELAEEEEDLADDDIMSGSYVDDISDYSVRMNLREIGKIPLVTHEEEMVL